MRERKKLTVQTLAPRDADLKRCARSSPHEQNLKRFWCGSLILTRAKHSVAILTAPR